jgi:predicted small lipoprotein YifL
MRRPQRLIAATVLIALSSALAGCGSMGNFDPSDLLDFLDTKKKLPGERKPVFPDGVPGLEQGVPKDLYKGSRQQIDDPNAQAAAAPPPEEPKAKRGAKSKGKQASTAPVAEPDAAAEEDGSTAAAPPAPKPKATARKRTTAPPPDQSQQSAAPFPAPMPSGSFTR